MKSIYPILREWRIQWLRFKLAHCNPMAPFYGSMIVKLNELERDK